MRTPACFCVELEARNIAGPVHLIEQDDMFSGSLVAIVTPMHADGSIDWPAWDRLLALHLAAGTSGIVVGGTTGESATLSDAELLAAARARARAAAADARR